jgi:hypothetical protein
MEFNPTLKQATRLIEITCDYGHSLAGDMTDELPSVRAGRVHRYLGSTDSPKRFRTTLSGVLKILDAPAHGTVAGSEAEEKAKDGTTDGQKPSNPRQPE